MLTRNMMSELDLSRGSKIGQGTFGSVLLCHTSAGEPVAVKVIPFDKKRRRMSFRREVAAMRVLPAHPNLLPLLAFDPHATDASGQRAGALALPLAPHGELLEVLLEGGRLPPPVARLYVRQLYSAVAAVHAAGVAHRDIKPENLLIDAGFNLRLCDFGFAVVASRGDDDAEEGDDWEEEDNRRYLSDGEELPPPPQQPQPRPLLRGEVGTHGYMAPEVLAGLPYCGFAADTWSTAVVAFLMAVGHPPVKAARKGDWWFDRLSRGDVERFWRTHERASEVCPSLRAFLTAVLRPAAAERSSAEEVLQEPGTWLQGEVAGEEEVVRYMAPLARAAPARAA